MRKRPELFATAIYLIAGTLWIVFSDMLVVRLVSGSSGVSVEDLQLAKGLFYVAMTGVLVYLLVHASTRATQRHNADLERRVAARTDELADLYHRAPCGYHSLDSEGRIIRINDREVEWLGYTRDELMGTPFLKLLAPESTAVFEQNFPEFKRRGEVYNLEFVLLRSDGSRLPVLLNATAIRDEQGEFLMSRSNLFDMTELVQARDRIESLNDELSRRNGELEARNRDLAAFSYSISHDLRAPVRAVTGFAEIVASRHGDALPDEARHYIQNIATAGARMNRLIDDLLRFARLGIASLEPQDIGLAPVLAEIAGELEPELASLGGDLRIEGGDVRVTADRSLLEQILSNLVQNALHYRSPARSPSVTVTVTPANGQVEVAVADNGIGIPAEHHERIFALFQRLQSDDHDGTGIGLALARRAAELLGGTLAVSSRVGEGSTFVLTLQEAHS